MWFIKIARFLNIISGPTAKVAGLVAAVFLAAMMFLTGADVTLRRVFNAPILGSYEMTEYMMSIVVALGLGWCALEKKHVRVDLVVSRLSSRNQAVTNAIASFLFLVTFIMITWQSTLRALGMIEVRLTSHELNLPIAPFVLVIAIGSIVLCLVLLKDFMEYLYQAVKK